MRSFEEFLLDAIAADAERLEPQLQASQAPKIDEAMQAMLSIATAIEIEVPAWARTIGVRFPCTPDELNRSFRQRALETHPDRPGGSHEAFINTMRARDEGLKVLAENKPAASFRYVR